MDLLLYQILVIKVWMPTLIVKSEDDRHIKPQWSIEFNTPLTQGLTPIYHGLHLYNVVSGWNSKN